MNKVPYPKLPSVHECSPVGLWALLVHPSDLPALQPSVIFWKAGTTLSPIACDPSYSLPRLSRLSISMNAIGLVVDQASWLFVGTTPDGTEVWLAFPGLWVQSPPPPQLLSLSSQALADIIASGVMRSPANLVPENPVGAPEVGQPLAVSSWLGDLLVHLGLVSDTIR